MEYENAARFVRVRLVVPCWTHLVVFKFKFHNSWTPRRSAKCNWKKTPTCKLLPTMRDAPRFTQRLICCRVGALWSSLQRQADDMVMSVNKNKSCVVIFCRGMDDVWC